MLTLTECPGCSSMLIKPFLVSKDHLVSQQDFCIEECEECGLLFTNPRPIDDCIGEYYKAEDYTSHNDTQRDLISYVYRKVRNYTLTKKESLIKSINTQPGRLLDYGCGTGSFLEKCVCAGWRAVGYEPDKEAAETARRKSRGAVYEDAIELEYAEKFDVITLWHVLEHVNELNKTLSSLSKKLKAGGHLVIAVPNVSSPDADYFGKDWAAYDVPRHLYHFRPTVLIELIRTNGLELERTIPMHFDAYYIALMSTKQRDGKVRYLESMIQGMRSNVKAASTGNYSSLTYVFKK